jgi:membrane protease YdiL (CAAX protease family)
VTDPLARVPPAVFFATTFALSWAVWLPLMLVRLEVLPQLVPRTALTPVGLLGVLMPAVAATILTGRRAGRPGLRRLYGRLRLWRVGRWWLPALLIQPCVLVLSALVDRAVGSGDPVPVAPGLSVVSVLASVVFLAVAATGEELGWRGLALPALQARSGAVTASVVLALVTATWHLPYWILQGALAEHGGGYLALNYLFFVALTFQLTWLVNHARGSVAIAVAFHVSFNIVNVTVLQVTSSTGAFALLTVAECALSLAVLRRLGHPEVGAQEPPAAGERRR